MSTCRSCGARVTWVRSAATGKWMILDEDPVPSGSGGGNVVVVRENGELRAHVFRDWQAAIDAYPCLPLYQDHHVTCPQASDWRRRGGDV